MSDESENVPENSILIGEYDVSPSYEVDMGFAYLLPDGKVYLRWASGCSCWAGEWYSDTYASISDMIQFGLSEDKLENFKWEKNFEVFGDVWRIYRP